MSAVIGRDGRFLQFQLGMPDIPVSISVVRTVWRYTGGMNGLERIFRIVPDLIKASVCKDLGYTPSEFLASFSILYPHGLVERPPDQADRPDKAFSGDARLQLVGFTLCAIAHLFDGRLAVQFIMETLAPHLLGEYRLDGVKEAFHAELTDNCDRIVNEGAVYGLTSSFEEAISRLQLPHVSGTGDGSSTGDDIYAVGFLTWLANPKRRGSYLTRSATVIRLAACLEVVGWHIGGIRTWANPDSRPDNTGGVILVISGSVDTDPLASPGDDQKYDDGKDSAILTHHYRNRTAGSALFNALHGPEDISPEAIQTWFEEINRFITANLGFDWDVTRRDDENEDPLLMAIPRWKKLNYEKKSNRTCQKLANLFFRGDTAINVASCFEPINSETHANSILAYNKARARDEEMEMPSSYKWLSIILVSILMSTAEVLGGEGYDQLLHATRLDLVGTVDLGDRTAIDCLIGMLSALETGYNLCRVVELLSAFHGALPFHRIAEDQHVEDYHCVGYQKGSYTVLPALFKDMKLGEDAIGFRCGNSFMANIPRQPDGTINSGPTDLWTVTYESFSSDSLASNTAQDAITHRRNKVIIPPVLEDAKEPLYISFERPSDYVPLKNTLLLAGQIGGELIGLSGISNILVTIVSSLNARKSRPICPGHAEPAAAFNIQPSTWMKRRYRRPMTSSFHHTYIPAQEDHSWALFLAGQVAGTNGRICFGCFDCLLEADGRVEVVDKSGDDHPRIYIGFG